MQKVQVTNTTDHDIAFLGLGRILAGEAKTGYIPEIVFDPDEPAYIADAAAAGIAIDDLSGLSPFAQTGRENLTGAGTVLDATRLVMLTAATVDYAVALPAASAFADGDIISLYLQSGAHAVTLTPNGSDTLYGEVGYNLTATPADGVTGFAITLTNTITRNDGGDWIAEGYLPGGRIVIQGATDVGNDGTFEIATVTASVLTVVGTGLTNNAADLTIHFGVDNRIILTLASPSVRLQSDGVSNWASV